MCVRIYNLAKNWYLVLDVTKGTLILLSLPYQCVDLCSKMIFCFLTNLYKNLLDQ